MRDRLKRWWPWLLKLLFTLALIFFIGRGFAADLKRLDLSARAVHPGWLVLSGVLYLGGLGFSALFWHRLLITLGQDASFFSAARGYYIGHLGKYLPGKAWALLVRAMLTGPHVRLGVAIETAFYEVFITMMTGALCGVVFGGLLLPEHGLNEAWWAFRHLLRLSSEVSAEAAYDRLVVVLLGLLLLIPLGTLAFPPVFNRLVYRLTKRFRNLDAEPLPPIGFRSLFLGIALIAFEWFLFAASLRAAVQAVSPEAQTWDALEWGRYAAFMGVAYVAGFVIVFVPSGLVIREFFLILFLTADLAPRLGEEAAPIATLAVLLLRLVWTVAEVATASGLYGLSPSAKSAKPISSPPSP